MSKRLGIASKEARALFKHLDEAFENVLHKDKKTLKWCSQWMLDIFSEADTVTQAYRKMKVLILKAQRWDFLLSFAGDHIIPEHYYYNQFDLSVLKAKAKAFDEYCAKHGRDRDLRKLALSQLSLIDRIRYSYKFLD